MELKTLFVCGSGGETGWGRHEEVEVLSVGHPTGDAGVKRTQTALEPFLDCLVLMLRHRPVHTQTTCTTLSPFRNTAEVRGN